GGPDDQGKPDLPLEGPGLLHRLADAGGRDGLSDGEQHLLEGLSVLGTPDDVRVGAQEAHAPALQYAGPVKVDGQVEAGLASEGGEDGVRSLALDHPLDRLDGERLYVDAVGDVLVGHDRRRV